MFHIASSDEIREGKVTDVYFLRTREVLQKKGLSRKVTVEFIVKSFPQAWNWGVFSGLEEALRLLVELDEIDVWAMREGTFFGVDEPALVIEGRYEDFGIYETALLGFLSQASGVATKAARCKIASSGKPVFSFGARRVHPAIAPMVERNAYLGGCDGVACVKSAEIIGVEPIGTIPHALILIFGDTLEAVKAFDEVIPPQIKRIALIDTFQDEKFEAINVAEELKEKLFGIRLDTPASRRGDFKKILQEVRWELDLRGHQQVKIVVSGGIDEYRIKELNPYVDAYGVGTSISNAPVLDFAMDIVEIEGNPIAKRGKLSGKKNLFRCPHCFQRKLLPWKEKEPICSCGSQMEPLLVQMLKGGKLLEEPVGVKQARTYVLEQMKYFKEEL